MQNAVDEIKERFGEGAIMTMREIHAVNVDVVPTGSIAMDLALGVGGMPRGRVVEIYGAESSGKTTLSLHVIAEAQKKGGICAFVDAEHAMDPDYAKRIGVDVDNLLISQPDSGEQALQIVETLVKTGNIDVIVIDSVAALTPQREIEGEIGDQHMGLQARLMSQACRKLSGIMAKSNTMVIFLNQTRMKIGMVFGCLNYKSKINLADGGTECIGKIVNQKKKMDILSYDWNKRQIISRSINGWFNNGRTDKFLQITAYKPYGNGKAQFSCTPNHPILTPTGWREADQLKKGDLVMVAAPFKLSHFQYEVIRGSIMGDGNLSNTIHKKSLGIRFRMGHCLKQEEYLKWKMNLLKNISGSFSRTKDSVNFDLTPLAELYPFKRAIYKYKYKFFSADFISSLTPLSLAVWYMDDGSLDIRDKNKTKGRINIVVQRMSPISRIYLKKMFKDRYDIKVRLRRQGNLPVFCFDQENTNKFLNLIKRFIHPSMEYKLLPAYRNKFDVVPKFSNKVLKPIALPITDIRIKPKTRSMMRFDIGVNKLHNFLADGVIVHNSPETTPGGLALKFYASVRVNLTRTAQIKSGDEIIGNRVKAKVVKNKVAAPFRTAEFDIYYNEGISKSGDALRAGLASGLIKQSGSFFTFEGEKIGQGTEAAKTYLKEHPEAIKKIKEEAMKVKE
ncbi:MAG: recombinase RecA [Candidatus Staskawiczbacteria bacterium RIFCSPLOWO2_01_FULL_37_25b]|uniref:Protein RecA n=1 Tax=Candidatus Staskawiczbacteria bacterium RIFCSPLOWO2_01_FULL_37_25b TaxID=1802213 RepID=A0A1G2ICJ1_9BACT|nr:MAG: recombinase RecA [Candidatus Staskawiczbacteria bacterium RIFCSPLOWO2_01_FULL_37_25b]